MAVSVHLLLFSTIGAIIHMILCIYVYEGRFPMRTNIVLDDELVEEAMRYTGLTTKKGVIEEALRTLVRLKSQESIRSLRGQLRWEGDLNTLRESRFDADAGSGYVDR
jgi:Arc/MetJ family transcription regulator